MKKEKRAKAFPWKKYSLYVFSCALLISYLYFWTINYFHTNDNRLFVAMCDVGQGDALLVRFPNRQWALVDAGPPDGSVRGCLDRYLPPWERQAALFALSHAHADHYGGARAVFAAKPPLAYFAPPYPSPAAWKKEEEDLGLAERRVAMILSPDPSVSLRMLNGQKPIREKTEDLNRTSATFSLVHGNFSMLFTGDLPAEEEERLVNEKLITSHAILKVGHHGSKYSSSHEFVDAVRPKLALVSAGVGNVYNHPHPATLRRFAAAGIPAMRTDLEGDICLWSDGTSVWLGCPRPSLWPASWQPALFSL